MARSLKASYYANYKKVVNGHAITWNKTDFKYDIADNAGKVVGQRQTEPDAIAFAKSQETLNRPSLKNKKMSTPAKKTTRKRTVSAKKLCSKVIKREGVKADGTLKKGYKYVTGGRVVKVKAPAKKKTGLGRVGGVCIRRNTDGSSTTYNSFGNSNPCPYGGVRSGINGPSRKTKKKPAAKKPIRKHEGINQRTGKLKPGYRYGANGRIVKAKAKK